MTFDDPLVRIISTKDLGVVFEYTLCFIKHIDEMIESSFKLLGFIKRKLWKIQKYRGLENTIIGYC